MAVLQPTVHTGDSQKPSSAMLPAAALVVVGEILKKIKASLMEKRKKKKMWIREWIRRRDHQGASNNLIRELRHEDPKSFFNLLRMDIEMFDFLFEKVASTIQKENTVMREAIQAKIKLEITLRYLATGDSLTSLQYLYRVPKNTISCFLPEVLDAIYNALKEYIKVPTCEEDWKEIERGFNDTWQFPNCVGSIDGKHIVIQCPRNSGSLYYNYKGTFSIVLMGMADHDYNFTFIDVGSYGSISDGGIFGKSALYKAIEENKLNLPERSVILGDEAFPLKRYLMKPYPRSIQLSYEQKIFNYRLCRARRIIENAFGILSSRFRVFRSQILLHPDKVVNVVKAACALHNWMRKTKKAMNCTVDVENHFTGNIIPGSWREDKNKPNARGLINIAPTQNRNPLVEAREKRDKLASYFIGEGAVPWQDKMID